MDEHLNQKISCLIDDELKNNEALALLKKIQLDSNLSQTLNRYQIARYALSSQQYLPMSPDFLKGVQTGISDEPNYLLPTYQKPHPKIIALAACAAMVTVIAFGMLYYQNPKMNTMSAPSLSSMKKSTPINHKEQTPAQTKRLNNYIQAHNNSLYTNGVVTATPYIQTASYQKK
ncbi:MAG: sigma-E factor negative regulatory protein [Methylococcales bacterium]|nr:sigma-E factor negative regulatory protein [Methylococcales bacterium]